MNTAINALTAVVLGTLDGWLVWLVYKTDPAMALGLAVFYVVANQFWLARPQAEVRVKVKDSR